MTPDPETATSRAGTVAPRSPANSAQPRRRGVTLVENVEVAAGIHVLTFSLGLNDALEFVPGQYVTFYLQRQGNQVTRSYSIYSSARLHDRFSLLIKRVSGGFASNLLCDLSPAEHPTQTILTPLGKFVYRDPGARRVVMVATGVGVAPFVPMLERLQSENPAAPTWLVWGNRFAQEIVDRGRLETWERSWPGFHFLPVLSRPPEDGSWKGSVGHVQASVRQRFSNLGDADVYLCGANQMVNEMQELALELGCPKDHVFVDRWGEHAQ